MRIAGARRSSREQHAPGEARGATATDLDGQWDVGRGFAGRPRPLTIVGVIAMVAVIGWLARGGAALAPAPPERFTIERSSEPLDFSAEAAAGEDSAGGQSSASPAPPDRLPFVPLTWMRYPDAPFDPVAESPVIPVGSTVVAVGQMDGFVVLGQATLSRFPGAGGIEERASEVWAVSSPSPLKARAGPYLAEILPRMVLVWGGRAAADGAGPPVFDGAVLDIGADVWTPVPSLPIALEPVWTAGWVADRLVVIGTDENAAPVALSWSRGDTEWQRLTPPPLERMTRLESVVTGDTLLIYGVASGEGDTRAELFTHGYDIENDDWRSYQFMPLQYIDEAAVVPTEPGEVFMWGRPSTSDVDTHPDGLTLSVETGAWGQTSPPADQAEDGSLTAMARPLRLTAAYTGQSIVIAADPDTNMLIYNLELDRWAALTSPRVTTGGQLAFADGRLVRWGGEVDGQPLPQLWVYPSERP